MSAMAKKPEESGQTGEYTCSGVSVVMGTYNEGCDVVSGDRLYHGADDAGHESVREYRIFPPCERSHE